MFNFAADNTVFCNILFLTQPFLDFRSLKFGEPIFYYESIMKLRDVLYLQFNFSCGTLQW